MTFQSRVKVRFGDEDHAQIVYYPRFFHFFHCAFEDFFDEQGFPYRDCLDVDRVGWPAVRVETDFARPLRFGDVVEIDVSVLRVGERSVTFRYVGTRRGDDGPAVRATIVLACIDMDTYRSTPIPDKYRALLTRHLEPAPA